ncbi:MAG TPA: hypothetical protein VM198_02930 [Longimicrobiales bacterium]|nr:hypothetical protein [Longimicrobiales bacterium]
MTTHFSLSAIAAVAAFALASPVLAQDRSAVRSADLDAAVATGPAPAGDAVRQLLSTEQVQNVAVQMGVSASELSARVGALDDATLARLAQQGGLADHALAGGADRIVITTTGVIIILLILILLVG